MKASELRTKDVAALEKEVSDLLKAHFGLKATEPGRLTARQIEAARRAISRHVKRGGRIWIRIFPDKPISQKPAEATGAPATDAPTSAAKRVRKAPDATGSGKA